MRTEAEIFLDYRTALNQAEELEALGREVEALAREGSTELMDQLHAAWGGENAENFGLRLMQLGERNETAGQSLIRIAETLRRIAGNTYEAELRALEIAKS